MNEGVECRQYNRWELVTETIFASDCHRDRVGDQPFAAFAGKRLMGLFAGTKWDLPPTCEACGKPQQQCTCPPCTPVPQWLPAEQQTAQVRVERRKAKRLVTVVAGLSQHESDLGSLLTRLQTACGAGGTQQGDELLLQGDHVVKVSQCLRQCGYRVKA